MRDQDRWWWLLLLTGFGFGVGGVAVLYFGVGGIPTDNPFITSADYWQLVGLWSFTALICLGGSAMFVTMAISERKRHHLRLAAFRGDMSGMPLADIRAVPASAPDVTNAQLDLLWRSGGSTRVFYLPILGLQVLILLISIGLSIFALLVPIFFPPQPSVYDQLTATPPQPMSVAEIAYRIIGTCVVVALVVILAIIFARVTPYLFGRPFGLNVTNAGIDARTEWGSQVHMTWDEMRLLEVVKGDARTQRRFALYAPGKRIDWAEYTVGWGTQYTPVEATASEMTLHQTALLNLIAARTQLVPRTLAKTLQTKSAPARETKRSSNVLAWLVLALILAGITAADYFFPMSPLSWLNWASIGSLALATGCLLVLSLQTAPARSALPASAVPPVVSAPSLEAPSIAYVVRWRNPRLSRLVLLLVGLCLAVNLAPGVWVLFLSFGLSLLGYHAEVFADGVFPFVGRFLLAFALVFLGVGGLGVAYTAAITAFGSIRADKDGLTASYGRRQRLLPWSSMQDISWGVGGRGRLTYLVTSDLPTFQISWPADAPRGSARPLTDGTIPIGPDELAAVVAAQITKPIRVREAG